MTSAAGTTDSSSSNNNEQVPWESSQIPSQEGKIAIVTGANSGIGFETAKALVEHHATVVLACRNEELGKQAQREVIERIEAQRKALDVDEREELAPPQVEFLHLDLASFASIQAFADAFRKRFGHLDLLINNAGVAAPAQKRTQDGIESQFGINHVGHFYLTKLLFDLLEKSPSARVVNVSSRAHRRGVIEFDAQGHLVEESGYAVSKLSNLLLTYELEHRLRASKTTNVITVVAHPGWTRTPIVEKFLDDNVPDSLYWLAYGVVKVVPKMSVANGALPTLYAATAEDVQGMEFFGPQHWGEVTGFPCARSRRSIATAKRRPGSSGRSARSSPSAGSSSESQSFQVQAT